MKKKKKTVNPTWTEFYRCTYWKDAAGTQHPIPDHITVYRNSIYTVQIQGCAVPPPMGPMAWLSIKRNDRESIHDWRDLQRIKNLIVGEETEAVEIYPAESRLNDTANQYHLWCFAPGYQLPFGYANRLVVDGTQAPTSPIGNAVQRPFPPDNKPADCIRGADLLRTTFTSELVHRPLGAKSKP